MEKLSALWNLFRKGECIDNPSMWKTHQITCTMLGGVLIAGNRLATSLGYPLPLDEASADTLGAGIICIVNIVLTIITSPKVGL